MKRNEFSNNELHFLKEITRQLIESYENNNLKKMVGQFPASVNISTKDRNRLAIIQTKAIHILYNRKEEKS